MMKKVIHVFILLLVSTLAHSQNLSPSFEQWYLWTEDNARLFVAEAGRGDSAIVIHGGWGAEYSYLIPALESSFDDYHFIFYDQRGSLRSPTPDSTISLQQFVSDLELLRQELDMEKVTLLSHSMGSFLAYAYLKKHPEHVKGMVLLSPVLPTGVNREKKRSADKQFVEFAKANEKQELKEQGLFDKKDLSAKGRTAKWRIGYASGNIYHIDRWEQLIGGQAFYNPDIARLINQNTTKVLMDDFLATLKSNSVPMYVIIGDHDLIDFGLSTWPDVTADIPHMNFLKLENAGHNSWIDKPEKFTELLEKALKQITR